MIFALDLLATFRLETFICYPICYQSGGWGRVVRSGTEFEGSCRVLSSGTGAIDQFAHEAAETGWVFLPSAVRHRIPESARGRGYAPRERHPALQGLLNLDTPRTQPVRTRRLPMPGGDERRIGSDAPRHRSPSEAVSASHLPAGDSRMRLPRSD